MVQLDLLQYQDRLRVKREEGKTYLFDRVRRKWVSLQPEELMRQLLVIWLIDRKEYNVNRISLERGLIFNDLSRRYDILIYDPDMQPFLLVECKSPRIELRQEAVDQVARYNMTLKVPYLLVSNGRDSYCYGIDHEEKTYQVLSQVPEYPHRSFSEQNDKPE